MESARVKAHRRRAISSAAAVAALLMCRGAAATDFTWDNEGGTQAWDSAINWNLNSGFPNSTADTATFSAAGNGIVNLNSSQTVGTLTFAAGATAFTIAPNGGGLVIDNGAGGGTLNQNAGNNTVTALFTANNVTANINAGTLTLTNTSDGLSNVINSGTTFNVASGATLVGKFGSTTTMGGGTSALGSAAIALNGGTLNLDGETISGGLSGQVFALASHAAAISGAGVTGSSDLISFGRANARHNTLTGAPLTGSAAYVVAANRLTTAVTGFNGGSGAGVNFNGFDYGNVPAAGPDVTGVGLAGTGPGANTYQALGYAGGLFPDQNNFVGRFTGKINISATGDYVFTTRSDDGSVLFIDGQLVVDNNNNQGMTNRTGTINLSAGLHDIQVLHYEGSGGSGLVVAYRGPDTVAAGAASGTDVVIPASVLSANQGRYTLGNAINVSGTSTINVNNADQAVMGNLTIAPGSTLTKGGAGAIRFPQTTLTGAGVNTYTFSTAMNDIALGNLVGTAGSTITIAKTGAGALILDNHTTAPSFGAGSTAAFNVQGGRLMVVSQNAAQNPLGNAAVTLNGSGAVLQLDSRTGNFTLDNPVTVSQSGMIEANSDNNTALTITLGSAANRLSAASGTTLTVDAFQNVTLVTNPSGTASTAALTKTGAGTLRIDQASGMTGATAINQGTLNVNIAGGINAASSTTLAATNAPTLQISTANAVTGPVTAGSGSAVNFAATNTYTAPLSNFTFSAGSIVTLGATNALGAAAQNSLLIATGSSTQVNLNASGAPADNAPLRVFTGGRAVLGNATAVHSNDTLALYPGSIFETNAAATGAGTILRSPGHQTDIRSNAHLSTATTQFLPANFGAFSTVRLRGDVADDLALNLATLSANSIIELGNGNRRISNTAGFSLANNPVFLTNDNAGRTINDNTVAGTTINAGGITIAATSNTTFQINDEFITGANSITFGTPLVLNGNRKDALNGSAGTPTVYLTNGASNFSGGTVRVVAGTQLRGQANTNASNFGAFGNSAANLMNPQIFHGTLRVDSGSTTANSGLAVGTLTAGGLTTLSVGRAAAGFNTTMTLNGAITRTNRGTVNLFTTNNVLGSGAAGAELIVFATPGTQAPARLTTSATINMVAPWMMNVSGSNTTSFVDYNTAGTVGFANTAYTTFAAGNLTGATDTTIADVTTGAVTVGVPTTVAALRTNQAISGAGPLTVATGGVIIQGTTARTIATPIDFGSAEGILHSTGGVIHVISNTITGSNGITKTGGSTLSLTGNSASTLTGTITVNQASLLYNSDAALGNANNPVVLNGGILRPNFTGSFPATRTLTLGAGSADIGIEGTTITYTIDGLVTGPGALVKQNITGTGNANVLVLANASNDYTGGTIIRQGTLRVSSNSNLGAASGPLTIDNGQFGVTASFSSSRTVFLTNANSAIDVATGQTLTLSGEVIGAGSLTKNSAGTLILSSATGNGYQGTTTVSAGTLLVNNGGLTGSGGGAVTVNNASILGGTGSLAGPVTLTGTSTLAPGASPGTLDIARDLTLGATTTLAIELAGTTPGDTASNYDQVNVTRSATLAGNLTASLLGGFTPSGADVFYVLSRDSGTGTFTGIVEGGPLVTPDGTFQVTYQANWTGTQGGSSLTGGNDVALYNFVPIPEPSTLALGGLGIGLLAARRRRRG